MPSKHDVIKAHKLHPDWTSKQIAIAILGLNADDNRLETADGWVRRTAQREQLTLGKRKREPKPPGKPRQDSIYALGFAARSMGLTVADILAVPRQQSGRWGNTHDHAQ